ncbi:GNAT family N-acetyltransferase [Clostridium septicum]|uniref:N-acetyltransferase domain-containing protein n=1 Tax=Clostridium septicum TaxID=1504 RepID=Q84IM6_CLOSE|nr:GNAT family N-acetyltransferase [Clostridium septicum]WLF68365.1 GNAT family N-acetyltransferase [Clostridium septicum]BAC57536.1 hypothetical protein [Clostridium septicum]
MFNNKVNLGERNEEIMKMLENIGFKKEYSALNMFLKDRNIKEEILDLVKLTKENKEKYLKVFNDSFSDMPNGRFCDLSDIEGYINKSNDKKYFFMVAEYTDIIGFMNCEIKKERGIFDIGLCKKYRGKGYGKKLLETAIEFLNKLVTSIFFIYKGYRGIYYKLFRVYI